MTCPKCQRKGAYIRFTAREIVCRQCGAISPLPDKSVGRSAEREKEQSG